MRKVVPLLKTYSPVSYLKFFEMGRSNLEQINFGADLSQISNWIFFSGQAHLSPHFLSAGGARCSSLLLQCLSPAHGAAAHCAPRAPPLFSFPHQDLYEILILSILSL
jgi:hypothetical protein